MAIKRIRVWEVVPGTIVARNVYSEQDQTLLVEQGTELSRELLDKLERWGVMYIPVGAEDEEETAEERAAEKIAKSALDRFAQARLDIETTVKVGSALAEGNELREYMRRLTGELFEGIKERTILNYAGVQETTGRLVDVAIEHPEIMTTLMIVKQYDNYLYTHSLNVAILSALTGHVLGLEREELLQLAEAGLLHDSGMLTIPAELWNKPGKLTEDERLTIKKHPRYSADIAEGLPTVDMKMVKGIAQHHERVDGNGYPRGVEGSRISQFGKILAVADTYDAMVCERPYRQRVLPYNTMREIIRLANKSLDQDVVSAFTNHMSLYPIGSVVVLSTGETGVVIMANRKSPLRPMVKVVQDDKHQGITEDIFIDLTKDRTIFINEAIFNDTILDSLLKS